MNVGVTQKNTVHLVSLESMLCAGKSFFLLFDNLFEGFFSIDQFSKFWTMSQQANL